MLKLSRKIGQSLMIGDDVVITVLKVNGKQVSIGISAPKSIGVHREEVYERIALETQASEPTVASMSQTLSKKVQNSTRPHNAKMGSVLARSRL